MTPKIMGLLILGVPALIIGAAALRRHRAVFFFFLALLAVGLGYLYTTPTPEEVTEAVLGQPAWLQQAN